MQNSTYEIVKIEDLLAPNPYPGRGIVIGKTPDGTKAVFAYFIMGRSENSRNRVFTLFPDLSVRTEPADSSKFQDPSLVIYAPIRLAVGGPDEENPDHGIVVTNGDQTDSIVEGMDKGLSFSEALRSREFEPDAPNWTPRISGFLNFKNGDYSYSMSILKSADPEGTACNRFTYDYASLPGVGHFIHTYAGDGNPLPTFTGEPERVYIPDDIDEFTNTIWDNLNVDNKISLIVRYVAINNGTEHSIEQRVRNKYTKV
ncbi:MAG: IMP cyclohydrolase [Clostridia bacterium]|nr:IMP cyclohydrolase [Clostridia bacterium]